MGEHVSVCVCVCQINAFVHHKVTLHSKQTLYSNMFHFSPFSRFYGVMLSTLDFESSDPSSNLGRT